MQYLGSKQAHSPTLRYSQVKLIELIFEPGAIEELQRKIEAGGDKEDAPRECR